MKKLFYVVITLILSVAVLLAVFAWQFDIDDYRSDIETAIYEQTGIKVVLKEGLEMAVSPELRLSAKSAQFVTQQSEIASFSNLQLVVDWKPLLQRQLVVRQILLENPVLELLMNDSGEILLPQQPAQTEAPDSTAPLPLAKVLIEDIDIRNLTFKLRQVVGVEPLLLFIEGLDLNLNNVVIADNDRLLIDRWPEYLHEVRLESQVRVDRLSYDQYRLTDLHLKLANNQQQINGSLTANAYGGEIAVQTSVDWQPENLAAKGVLKGQGIALAELLKALRPEQLGTGVLNLEIDAIADSISPDSLLQSLRAEIYLTSPEFVLEGIDLDRVVTNLLDSQNLNLKDIGGLALAGPLGLALTKGGSYGGIINSALGGRTTIKELHGHWRLQDQHLQFSDVALKTGSNRVAVTGHVDLGQQQFGPLNLYLLDKQGCHQFHQKIRGPLDKPQLGAVNFAMGSVLNPLMSLAKQGGDILVECKPVYQGKVEHP